MQDELDESHLHDFEAQVLLRRAQAVASRSGASDALYAELVRRFPSSPQASIAAAALGASTRSQGGEKHSSTALPSTSSPLAAVLPSATFQLRASGSTLRRARDAEARAAACTEKAHGPVAEREAAAWLDEAASLYSLICRSEDASSSDRAQAREALQKLGRVTAATPSSMSRRRGAGDMPSSSMSSDASKRVATAQRVAAAATSGEEDLYDDEGALDAGRAVSADMASWRRPGPASQSHPAASDDDESSGEDAIDMILKTVIPFGLYTPTRSVRPPSPRRSAPRSAPLARSVTATRQHNVERPELAKTRRLLAMVSTSHSIDDAYRIVRPIRVMVPVAGDTSSKERLRAFDTATLFLAQKCLALGGNLVIATTYTDTPAEVVATGTAIRLVGDS